MEDMQPSLDWRRSRHCDTGACVEVATIGEDIAIRDSKHPDRQFLRFSRDQWRAFVDGIRAGEFTLD